MKEIDKFLKRACRSLRVAPSLKSHIREELREHLLESMESHVKEGLSQEEAVRLAIKEFGSPDIVGDELSSIHSQDLFSFVLDRAMSWREKTMKTGWKWDFVALAAMALVIGLEVLMSWVCVVFVFPKVAYTFDSLGLSFPAIFAPIPKIFRFLSHYGFVPLCVILGGWILFEVKYRKESKPNIRLAASAVICAGMTLLFVTVCFGTLIPATMLAPGAAMVPSYTSGLRSASMVSLKLTEADIILSRLSDACEKRDWNAARTSARDLRIIFQAFEVTSYRDVTTITGRVTSPEESEEIRQLLRTLHQQSYVVLKGVRSKEFSAIPARVTELEKSYVQFKEMLGKQGR